MYDNVGIRKKWLNYPAPDEFPHKGMFFASSTYQLAKRNNKQD